MEENHHPTPAHAHFGDTRFQQRKHSGGWRSWRYGFGWIVDRVNDRLIVSHTGNIIGFSSAIERNVDDGLTVILFDNRFDSQEVAGKLAYNIARLYLWTGPRYQPIPDKEPKITDRVRGIVDRFDHGKLSAADFTPLMWSELSPWRKQAEQDGKTLGPALSLALVERTTEAGRQSYRYRISYKSQTNLLHVAIDEQNKIAIWKVEDVDIN